MAWKLRREVVCVAGVFALGWSALSHGDEPTPIKYPFVDWYGIWPGRVSIDESSAAWTQDMPGGVRPSVQTAQKSKVFITAQNLREKGLVSPFTSLPRAGLIQMRYLYRREQEGEDTLVVQAESDAGFDWRRPHVGLLE